MNLLDLRTEEAFLQGHAPHAANIPWVELPQRMHELPAKGGELVIWHPDPGVMAAARAMLEDRAYAVRAIETPDNSVCGRSARVLWEPSPFLSECLRPITPTEPRVAADLGCGSGREAVCLAREGWEVDAFDCLRDALEKASDLARRSAVSITTRCEDVEAITPPRQYSLVCCFRFLPRKLLGQIEQWLVPGGYLIVESFHREDARRTDRRYNPARLLNDGELPQLANGLDVIIARDRVERDGRCFSQLLARKKPDRSV